MDVVHSACWYKKFSLSSFPDPCTLLLFFFFPTYCVIFAFALSFCNSFLSFFFLSLSSLLFSLSLASFFFASHSSRIVSHSELIRTLAPETLLATVFVVVGVLNFHRLAYRIIKMMTIYDDSVLTNLKTSWSGGEQHRSVLKLMSRRTPLLPIKFYAPNTYGPIIDVAR